MTSPSYQVSPKVSIWYLTASCIDPRCTGKCGAFAIKEPSGPNMAHEKSSLSLILVEQAVLCKVFPIYSAIDMNLLAKIESTIGSLA